MNKNNRFKAKNSIAALALAVCMSLPCSSFAFMNPNQDSASAAPEKDGFENSAAAVLSPGEIGMAAASDAMLNSSGLMDFNRGSGRQWQATFSAQTGKVKRLYGATSKIYSGTPESAARAFLQDSHKLFGLQVDLAELTTASTSPTPERQHVKFQRTINGVPVQGATITVHSDPKGRVTMVQNNNGDATTPANQNLLSRETAESIARNHLSAQLGARSAMSPYSEVENLIVPRQGGYRYIWKITIPTKTPSALWVYHVDSESGEILYLADEIFNLRDGKGRVYLTNEDWYNNYKLTNVKLEDLFETEDGYVEGFLHGLHATIHDYPAACTADDTSAEKCKKLDGYNLAYSNNLNFIYDPFAAEDWEEESQKPWFDQVQAYYQMTAAWTWWEKNVLRQYGPETIEYFYWLSIPAAVNIGEWDDAGSSLYCESKYTPLFFLEPPYGDVPGFLFSDDESCFDEDLVVDVSIVRHEYAHAIMDWAGFDDQFHGEVDGYGRAMGEGNADWYAFLATQHPAIGYVAFPPWGLRTIDNNNRYPGDVNDPGAGQPEEHYTGEIWGGYLYDLSRVLKKQALKFIYPSSFYFSADGGHRDGYPDFVDALRAQRDAELDLTGYNKQFLKAFGSMVSRGLIRPLAPLYSNNLDYFGTGAPGSDERDYLWLNAPLKLKTEANMLITGDLHEYPVDAYAGMTLTAQVKAKAIGMRGPSIKLYSIDGTLLDFIDYSNNTQIKKASLTYTIPADGMYVVQVSGRSEPRRGYYTFQLSVQ